HDDVAAEHALARRAVERERRDIDAPTVEPKRERLGPRVAVDELADERTVRAERVRDRARERAEELLAGEPGQGFIQLPKDVGVGRVSRRCHEELRLAAAGIIVVGYLPRAAGTAQYSRSAIEAACQTELRRHAQ